MRMKERWILGTMGVLLLLAGTGCSPENSNRVSTDGSTSMERVIGMLGEAFELAYPAFSFTYNPTGSGSGIQAVADGRCEIGLSSRTLKDAERALGLTETVLAYDGIAVIVHPDNSVSDLSIEQLTAIYTGQITDWAEVGGMSGEIVLIGREAGSGTRDGFESITGTEYACIYRQELTSSGDVITTVSSNPNAIGYTSLASVKEGVTVLSIDSVFPSEQTIQAGAYTVQRPFLLITREDEPLSPAAQQFYAYICSSEAADLIVQAGVIPPSAAI